MSTETITIDATVAAEPTTVWQYWTQPEHITQWNFAAEDWHCPSASNDVQVGGKLISRMEAKDGSFGFDFEATYEAVDAPHLLTYVLDDGRKVCTRFEAVAGGTKITTEFEPEKENPVDLQRHGWQAILNNFKSYSEQL